MIKENQTKMFAQFPLSMRDTMMENGIWRAIPAKAYTPNIFSGTETRYSWKNAEMTKTADMTVILEYPLFSRGT